MAQSRRSRGSGPGTVPGTPPYGRRELPEMKVMAKAKELEVYTFKKTSGEKSYPKKYRITLVNRIQSTALDITDNLMEVNDLNLNDSEERAMRFRAHRAALRACRRLLRMIELSKSLEIIDADSFAYWGTMTTDVKNMAAAWYKADSNRAAKGDAGR